MIFVWHRLGRMFMDWTGMMMGWLVSRCLKGTGVSTGLLCWGSLGFELGMAVGSGVGEWGEMISHP